MSSNSSRNCLTSALGGLASTVPSLPDGFTVATPLLARRRRLIATISAAVDALDADHLDGVREELKKAVATLGPKYRLDAS